jgi:hypothetical protein
MKGIAGAMAAVCVLAAAAARAQDATTKPDSRPSKPAAGGWWDDVFTDRETTLGKILAAPEAWRGVPASFVVQFRQPGRAEPSFFTKFDPDQWLSFVVWPDEAALWEKKAYDDDFRHLFVKRTGPEAKVVGSAGIYDRMAVTGVVRDVIKGRPWIEVTSLRRLPEKLTEGSLVHLVKGLMFRDHRRFDAAAREFEAADGEGLPLQVRLVGMREHAFALLNAKEPEAAEERLLAALALDPENSETAVALADLRERARRMPKPASRPAVVVPPAEEVPGSPSRRAPRTRWGAGRNGPRSAPRRKRLRGTARPPTRSSVVRGETGPGGRGRPVRVGCSRRRSPEPCPRTLPQIRPVRRRPARPRSRSISSRRSISGRRASSTCGSIPTPFGSGCCR